MSSAADTSARLPAHLYVHVPFCRSKCSYCDFFSLSDAAEAATSRWVAEVLAEARWWGARGMRGALETVYVGGGTPSLVAEKVAAVLAGVSAEFAIAPGAEVTVEANPDSLDAKSLASLRAAGVTRVSVGVQSFDDTVLGMLGRRHDSRRAAQACADVREAGLALSVDLICGVPGQSLTSWAETIATAVATGARHVSVYPLALEEGTPLAVAVDGGIVEPPDPDTAADMMVLAEESLARAGLARYEVANYAVPGAESRHNLAYWSGVPYLALGPAAHGMLDVAQARVAGLIGNDDYPDAARVRWSNAADLEWRTLPREVEVLTREEVAREDVMLGLRLVHGVAEEDVRAAELEEVMAELGAEGLVVRASGRWRTTARGWLLGNEVFERVWCG
ncbi:MAG: radical SAM family heme chaperone HemW [Anaerosomatales bacterium]|nr:radical SAM family heme chaperone HemW [Anaerosomatales bacterium]